MKEKNTDLILDPSQRICPEFDHTGSKPPSQLPEQGMGVQVRDNCAQDHIM